MCVENECYVLPYLRDFSGWAGGGGEVRFNQGKSGSDLVKGWGGLMALSLCYKIACIYCAVLL